MTYRILKYFFFVLSPLVVGSFKASANISLPIVAESNNSLTEIQEGLLTGDSILLIGFFLWVAYIVFCFPKDTLKKL